MRHTLTPTNTNIPAITLTASPAFTITPTPTFTNTEVLTYTNTPTGTPTNTPTWTPTWTQTLIPSTPTFTSTATTINISYDSSSKATRSNGFSSTTLSWTHTCAAAPNILIVTLSTNGTATVSSVAFGGSSMVLSGSQTSGNVKIYKYYLLNAPTGAFNITATTSARSDLACAAVSYKGVYGIATPAMSLNTGKGVTLTGTTGWKGSYIDGGFGNALALSNTSSLLLFHFLCLPLPLTLNFYHRQDNAI